MAIPKEILAIERPKSTVVRKTGNIYYVIKRTSEYKNGKSIPKDLGTVGKIINGKYVPLDKTKKILPSEINIKDFGEIALCNSVSSELLKDLKEIYDEKDSNTLLTIALLRAAYGNITDRDLKIQYETSYLSELYPNISLSESGVCNFLDKIGKAYTRILKFMKCRVEKISKDSTVILDGTLKDNNSQCNSFSEFSRKGKTKGSKDLSLLYLYDINKCEPVACNVYQGNMLDQTSFGDFVRKFMVIGALMVLDKGFYKPDTLDELRKIEGLEYIIPLKASSKIIINNKADENFDGILEYKGKIIHYKKVIINDGKYLYSFKDEVIASVERQAYIQAKLKKEKYNEEKLKKDSKKFGLIVFESNSDRKPIDVYQAYEQRWEIELMFQFYKNIIGLKHVRVHSDYRVYASEFINFLSTIISCKIRNKINELKLNEKYSYKQIMLYLSKYKKYKDIDGTWKDTQLLKYTIELINKLSIV